MYRPESIMSLSYLNNDCITDEIIVNHLRFELISIELGLARGSAVTRISHTGLLYTDSAATILKAISSLFHSAHNLTGLTRTTHTYVSYLRMCENILLKTIHFATDNLWHSLWIQFEFVFLLN